MIWIGVLSWGTLSPLPGQSHYEFTSNTGNNATVAIPVAANPNINGTPLTQGDEIGAFAPSGLCVGAVSWSESNTAITVWGDNDLTPAIDGIRPGELMSYRVWQTSAGSEYRDVAVRYSQGNGQYSPNGILIVSSFDANTPSVVTKDGDPPKEFVLSQNWPNPFNSSTSIRYGLPHRASARLELFDIQGQRIAVLVDMEQTAGYHSISFAQHDLPAGIYFCRLLTAEGVRVMKILLLR